jgi:hypothetical protein
MFNCMKKLDLIELGLYTWYQSPGSKYGTKGLPTHPKFKQTPPRI